MDLNDTMDRVVSAGPPAEPRGLDLTLYSDDELTIMVSIGTEAFAAECQAEIDRRAAMAVASFTTPTIPALLTTPTGQIVEAETGAVLSDEDAGSLLAKTLETYRRAKIEAAALELRRSYRRDEVLATLADDEAYCAATFDLASAQDTIRRIEATLAGMFTDRAGKVSIDTPAAKVTWSEGRQTWSLAHPASWYADDKARQELENLLRLYRYSTMDNRELAFAVLAWLAPTAKTGDAPAPRITLRDGAA